MTWSYNPSLLQPNDPTKFNSKDAVRLLIGDTVDCDHQLEDEEIAFFASRRSTLYGAAAECCRAMAAKFSRAVDQQGGQSKLSYSQMAKAYTVKAIEFEQKAALSGAALPYAGGISVSDMQMRELQADRVQPQFAVGMTENTIPVQSIGTESTEDDVAYRGLP